MAFMQHATLQMHVRERVLFQRPSVCTEDPSEDPIVSGVLVVEVPKGARKRVKALTVVLSGRSDIAWPKTRTGRTSLAEKDSVEFFRKELPLSVQNGEEELVLTAGKHSFDFEVLVPSSLPPTESHASAKVTYSLTATLKTTGKARTEKVSDACELLLVPNPGGSGGYSPPGAMRLLNDSSLADIGTYHVGMYSSHAMIGGLMLLRMKFDSFASRVQIYSIRVRVEQTISLHSASLDDKYNEHSDSVLAPQAFDIAVVDAVNPPNDGHLTDSSPVRQIAHVAYPLKTVEAGEGLEIFHLARFPDDQRLQPTTQAGTDTPVRVSHRIVASMIFRPLPAGREEKAWLMPRTELQREKRVLSMTQPNISLHSCYSSISSLELPLYEEHNTGAATPFMPSCTCKMPVDQLVAEHGQALLAAHQGGAFEDQEQEQDEVPTKHLHECQHPPRYEHASA